ncbi:MAG: thiolase domain-containing protein [Anaerolineae bacterium]|nr:thiolase domain-containing protein [Anaerolineae bacterium]MBN8617277.1 thiolase domain-containing protein [Anaerolineae bacterium]
MRDLAIIGIGQIPVGEHWTSGLRTLAAEAIYLALEDAGIEQVDALYVGNAYGSSYSSQTQLGALIADHAGLANIEAFTVEAAEASGGAAIRTAYLAVASGAIETALVLGVEKSTDTLASARVEARSVSLDADYEAAHGATLTAMAAMLMRRYMHEYNLDLNAFEGFSINAHANGNRNQNAMFKNLIKPGRFASAPMISEPINLFDNAPDADGAAAIVITSLDRAVDMVPMPVRLTASAVATDTLALADRSDPLYLKASNISAHKAFAKAGVTKDAVDLFELHDAFTILTALTLEAITFANRGEGWKLAQPSVIGLNGSLPISTFGGLKARGNPGGATGVYQAVEACLQLRGQAGSNQVPNAKVALIQNLGGLGSTAVSHILQI